MKEDELLKLNKGDEVYCTNLPLKNIYYYGLELNKSYIIEDIFYSKTINRTLVIIEDTSFVLENGSDHSFNQFFITKKELRQRKLQKLKDTII